MAFTIQKSFIKYVVYLAFVLILFWLSQRMTSWPWIPASVQLHVSSINNDRRKIEWTTPGNITDVHTTDGQMDNQVSRSSCECGVGLYVDIDNVRKLVREKNKTCYSIDDPFTMWKSQPSNLTKFTANMDMKRIESAIVCGGVLYSEYLNTPPRAELYPFEMFYLSEPPLWDESTVACHNHSTISLLGSNTTFSVGDTVELVIKMSDRQGRPRLKGGDRIKVWLKDVKLQHSISAKITDFNNGTYLATTVLPWAGSLRVMATLRQPREFFRALAYIHRAIKSTITFAGAYSNSQASEAVPCSPFPIVPGFQQAELCNLTSVNGSPWYCGRPSKMELSCSDFKLVRILRIFYDMPVTSAEDRLLRQSVNQSNFLQGNISLTVQAAASGITRLKDPDVPCNQVSPRSTWHQAVPPGYFYNKVWKSFLCHIPEKFNSSCLKDLHIVSYGDSNARIFYDNVRSKIRCPRVAFARETDWNAASFCKNEAWNFSMHYMSHANPYHIGWDYFNNYSCLYSIASTGRHIIVLTHYLHFASFHISAYERALAAVRDALVKLINRNSQVLIVLRGPHVTEIPPFRYAKGDVWAEYFHTIQRETFKDLQDSVIYVPTWDMTVASEDTHHHPACNPDIAHIMLQFICGRKL